MHTYTQPHTCTHTRTHIHTQERENMHAHSLKFTRIFKNTKPELFNVTRVQRSQRLRTVPEGNAAKQAGV